VAARINPDYSSQNDKLTEADIYRQELGSLITDLRLFIGDLRKNGSDWYPAEIADHLEEIIDG